MIRLLLLILAGTVLASGADKPTAYDHVTKDGADTEKQVNAALAPKYDIVRLEDSPSYVRSKVTAGDLPHSARTATGQAITGYVLLAFVVTADGLADDPVVIKSTDERLNSIALESTKTWRFKPAQLDGSPVAVTAAQEFNFTNDGPPVGFATENIVLYQPNDVLVKRLPGGADQLAAYIKELQDALTDFFATDKTPETLQVVVAVRPSGESRVWFISSIRSGSSQELKTLRKKLEAINPVEVRNGPVAFAICADIAGGDGKKPPEGKEFHLPMPKEWQEAAKDLKKPVLVPDGFLNAAWPEKK